MDFEQVGLLGALIIALRLIEFLVKAFVLKQSGGNPIKEILDFVKYVKNGNVLEQHKDIYNFIHDVSKGNKSILTNQEQEQLRYPKNLMNFQDKISEHLHHAELNQVEIINGLARMNDSQILVAKLLDKILDRLDKK